jgi:hypothetical protein
MKIAWIVIGLAAAYLVGQLYTLWRSRRDDIPPPPPGGWKKGDWDDDEDDWPDAKGH